MWCSEFLSFCVLSLTEQHFSFFYGLKVPAWTAQCGLRDGQHPGRTRSRVFSRGDRWHIATTGGSLHLQESALPLKHGAVPSVRVRRQHLHQRARWGGTLSPDKTEWKWNDSPGYQYRTSSDDLSSTVLFSPPGVLVCVFSIVAVHGGLAPWSVSILAIIVVVCLILTFIVWRQPQSKAKLAFKVENRFFSHYPTISHSRTYNTTLSECDKRDV